VTRGSALPEQNAAAAELAQLNERDLRDPAAPRGRRHWSRVQDRIGAAAAQKEQENRALGNTLSRLSTTQPGLAEPLTNRLRRSDFAGSDAALRELSARSTH